MDFLVDGAGGPCTSRVLVRYETTALLNFSSDTQKGFHLFAEVGALYIALDVIDEARLLTQKMSSRRTV